MSRVRGDMRRTSRQVASQSGVLPRVLLSIRRFHPPHVGGAEIQARRLAACLVQRGVPVTVLTGRYSDRPHMEVVDGVQVRRHFIGAYVPVVHELCYLVSLAWELVARRREYDIVHLFQTQLSTFVAVVIAGRFLGKRVITRSSGAEHFGVRAIWLSIPCGKWLLRYLCANVHVVVGVSSHMIVELEQTGFDPKVIWYIPNGVPIVPTVSKGRLELRTNFSLPPKAFIAICVSRLKDLKEHEFLINVWSIIRRQYPEVHLVLLGEGERGELLRAKVRRESLAQAVTFAGWVDNVNEYLEASDVFVLPSAYEGMSNALLEAMAVGLPVVASRVSGSVDVIDDGVNGMLFERGDVKGFIDCLTSLIESPELRAELSRKARKTVEERFSLDAAADRYISLYKSLGI